MDVAITAAIIGAIVLVFLAMAGLITNWFFQRLNKIEEDRRADVRAIHKSIGELKQFTFDLMSKHEDENREFRDSVNRSIGGLKARVTGKVNGDG